MKTMKNTKKRMAAGALTACLVLASLPMGSAFAANNYTTTGSVNIRAGAGTTYDIVVTVPEKATVNVKETSKSGWYKVEYTSAKTGKKYTGYMSNKYLKQGGSSNDKNSSDKNTSSGTTYVTTGSVNMRTGPGVGNTLVTTLPANAKVSLIETASNGWMKVDYKLSNGAVYTGYVSGKYLKKSDGSSDSKTSVQYTTSGRLNLRSKASKSGDVILTIPGNTTVTVIDTSDKEWYKAEYTKSGKKYTGYLASKHLKKGAASDQKTPSDKDKTDSSSDVYTVNGRVNVRTGAGPTYDLVVTVPDQATVTVTDTSNKEWYKVQYKSSKTNKTYIGYMSSKYLTKGKGSSDKKTEPKKETSATYITTGNVNMRSAVGTTSPIVITVPVKAKVTVVASASDGWYKAEYVAPNGTKYTGYMSGKYLVKQ